MIRALADVALVSVVGIMSGFAGWHLHDVAQGRRFRRIESSVLAHYREPANDAALREGAPRRKVT